MFTGIVTDIGEVLAVEDRGEGLRQLTIASSYDASTIAIGASIACSGVCMTAVATGAAGNRHATVERRQYRAQITVGAFQRRKRFGRAGAGIVLREVRIAEPKET